MATITSKTPKALAKKPIKLTFSAGDIGAWFNDPETDGSDLEWQVQSRRQDDERGFDLVLNNPDPKPNNHIDNTLFVGWYDLRSKAQERATKLTNGGLTWEKAKKRFGPYNRDKNKAITAKPHRY